MICPVTTAVPISGRLYLMTWWERSEWRKVPRHLRPEPYQQDRYGVFTITEITHAPVPRNPRRAAGGGR